MPTGMDQAEGLRRLLDCRRTRVIAVTALAPGAGATTTSMNLALQLTGHGKPVLLVDEHAGTDGCACARWGVQPAGTLGDVAARRLPVGAAAARVAPGLAVLPGTASDESPGPHVLWPDGVVIVDARLAASGQLSALARLADDIVVVMQPTRGSITATYAGLKRLQFTHALQVFHFLVNQAGDAGQAAIVSRNVMDASRRFLAVSMRSLGAIARDSLLRDATSLQGPPGEDGHACSPAREGFRRVAAALAAPPAWSAEPHAAARPPVPAHLAGAPA